MRRNTSVRIVALTAVILSSLLVGCHDNAPIDTTKLPNKDLKAGPPTASPAELEQIRQHMQSGH